MAKPSGRKKIRVQLDFMPEAYDTLGRLQKETGAPSLVETVRYAMRVLFWVTAVLKSGGSIYVEQNGKTKHIMFPFLLAHDTEEVQV